MSEMQPKSDAQLLREYAERGEEAAICGNREEASDLVYSAAMRQVASPHIAADVAQ